MPPIIVDKAAKKKDILQAALDVFVEKGFSNVVINDIAKAAGIGKGTVYEYFRSREDLFGELLNFLFQNHQQYTPKEWDRDTPPEEKLRELLSYYIQSYIQNASKRNKVLFTLVDYLTHNTSRKGTSLYKGKKFFTGYRNDIRRVVEEGIRSGAFKKMDVDLMVTLITMVLDGMMFQMFLFPKGFPVKDIGPIITNMVLTYVKA
jgi:AcrR family transcriptional regulator